MLGSPIPRGSHSCCVRTRTAVVAMLLCTPAALVVGCQGIMEETRDGAGCVPESDPSTCARHGIECGSFTGEDNCGAPRTVSDCGACPASERCGGGAVENVCGEDSCSPESDQGLCLRLGKDCGSLTAADNCGTSRTVASCGTCPADESCGGGGAENVCGFEDSGEPDGQTTCTGGALRCEAGVLQRCENDSWQEQENCEAQGKVCANEACADGGPSSNTPVGRHGALRVQGSEMVDEQGQSVQLKGVSLFWHNWMGQYYNAATVSWLVDDWNISVVRAAIGVEVEAGYLQNEADAKAKARAVINAAIDKGIYVIVDWHTHSVDSNRNQAKAFFEEMAREYGDTPNIIYEVFNEPVDQPWSQIKSYAEDVIRAIRAIDSDNVILVGCRTWSQEILEPANDPISGQTNIAYVTHFYAGTHKQSLRDRVKAALDKGIHVFVTEWGTSQADGGSDGVVHLDESNLWIDFMAQHKLSWCNWSIADKTEASAALLPQASGNGGWSDAQLTESGKYVRSKIKGN